MKIFKIPIILSLIAVSHKAIIPQPPLSLATVISQGNPQVNRHTNEKTIIANYRSYTCLCFLFFDC